MAKQKQPGKAKQQPAPVQQPTPKAIPVQPIAAPSPAGMAPVKWLMIILAAVVLLVNMRTIGYDYTLDDPFFTKDNPNVSKGLSAIKEFFTHAAYYGVFKHHDASYRPLMLTSFALEKDLFGFNPATGHLINLLLFALEVVVLFSLLRSMFRNVSPYIPFFMTLLFALHPMHTEVIASIKSRDEIMGLLFSALALQRTLRYADDGKMKDMILSGVWFFCALMSKETPIALVLIAPMTVWFFRDAPFSKIVRMTVPYVAVAVVYLAMRSMFIESDGEKVVILVNNNGLMAATNYADKLATTLYIQLRYLVILLVPHPLSYDYSYSQIPIIGFSDPKALAAVAVIIALFVYAVRGFKKKDVLAYCILFYGMSVIITSNLLVDIGATMAERFIFTGSLGYCIALVWLLAKLLKAPAREVSFANSRTLFVAVLATSVLYGGKTMARNEAWRSNLDLYLTGMETAPNSWRAQYLLGVEYTRMMNKETDMNVKRELYTKTVVAFNRSLQILPNNSDVYLLKGYAEEFAGQYDSAIVSYSNTVRLDSGNAQAAVNLGGVFLRTGRLDEAIHILSRVLARDGENVDALTNIGAAHGNKGLFRESIGFYEKAVRLRPEQPANVYMSMSNVYRFLGDSASTQRYRQLMVKAAGTAAAQ
ncbi:tetratricopeptide repeat protein [Nemorincola caseinilytica]|uniref:dolichyl-phosphate-mannose--protein mannosyltransferase n=1 Tax=Nemorincola caseinilytica TaxID=2054315 RepID=A0ABP8NP29_9BACT